MDPAVLARIGNLELVSRAVVDGFINGLHKAPYFGASVDFAEHRGYVPGDDIRRMDWRVWARTDRYYIKEYEAESNMNFSVLLDVSKSMDYGSRGITKLDYARILAACLTNLVHHQRDRVGLRGLRRRRRGVRAAVGQAHGDGAARARPAEAGPAGQPEGAAAQAGRALRPPRHAGADLRLLRGPRDRARGRDAAAVPRQRHHRVPRPRPAPSSSSASPTRRRSRISRRASRCRWCPRRSARNTGRWCRRTSRRCARASRRCGVDYTLLDTSQPLDHALFTVS